MKRSLFTEHRLVCRNVESSRAQPEQVVSTPVSADELKKREKLTDTDYNNAWYEEIAMTSAPFQQRFENAVTRVQQVLGQQKALELRTQFAERLRQLIWNTAAVRKRPGAPDLYNNAQDAWRNLYEVMYSAEREAAAIAVTRGTRRDLEALQKQFNNQPRAAVQKPVAVETPVERAVREKLFAKVSSAQLLQEYLSLNNTVSNQDWERIVSRAIKSSNGDLKVAVDEILRPLDARYRQEVVGRDPRLDERFAQSYREYMGSQNKPLRGAVPLEHAHAVMPAYLQASDGAKDLDYSNFRYRLLSLADQA